MMRHVAGGTMLAGLVLLSITGCGSVRSYAPAATAGAPGATGSAGAPTAAAGLVVVAASFTAPFVAGPAAIVSGTAECDLHGGTTTIVEGTEGWTPSGSSTTIAVQWGAARLTTAGGAWAGRWAGVIYPGLRDEITGWYRGTGAYTGLTYTVHITGSLGRYTLEGLIYPGEPPTWP